MIDAFISYSSKEKAAAYRMCDLLEKGGIRCWMAPRNIPLGSHWAGSILQALRNAKIMVLLFSKNANDSQQVIREVSLAASNRLVIMPVKIDDTLPSDDMEYFLSISHWLDASNRPFESTMTELITTIRSKLKINTPKQAEQRVSVTDPMGGKMLDIYEENMDSTGTALRADVHLKGLWHKTFHFWFVSCEAKTVYVCVQRRSNEKADFPGLFDITAARHLNAGESDREGINQIDKELGVVVDFENVIYLGVRQYAEKRGSFYNREFNSVYLYDSPYALGDFVLQPAEVSGILKISAEDGLRLFSGKAAEIAAVGCLYEDGIKSISKICITAEDFVPRVNDYYRKIFTVAKDYFSGVGPLTI
jgi:isopentenyldiphosphate isomerase